MTVKHYYIQKHIELMKISLIFIFFEKGNKKHESGRWLKCFNSKNGPTHSEVPFRISRWSFVAEIFWALHIVNSNMSINSNKDVADIFKKMDPNSKIFVSMKLSRRNFYILKQNKIFQISIPSPALCLRRKLVCIWIKLFLINIPFILYFKI